MLYLINITIIFIFIVNNKINNTILLINKLR